jgi:hypothetical protein
MPDVTTDGKKAKTSKLGKYKWWIVGGLVIIAVLVFYFTRSSSANNSSTAANSAAANNAGIDPSTGIPYASEYASGGLSGLIGPTGATGPAGPAGPRGKTGKTGKTGKPAPKKKTASVAIRMPAHPALTLASAHAGNSQRALSPKPARKAA